MTRGCRSTRKCPPVSSRTFSAPSRKLPFGMCGSKQPKTETMREFTSSSLERARIVRSRGEKIRRLGANSSRAYDDPPNGVATASIEQMRGTPAPCVIAYLPTSPPLLWATMMTSSRRWRSR
ncbi:hypothetical protein ACFPRL_19045 [Pseudoclavibacter helvolus]